MTTFSGRSTDGGDPSASPTLVPGNSGLKAAGVGANPGTEVLNKQLQLALDNNARDSALDPTHVHNQMAEILKSTDTPFDTETLDLSLTLAIRVHWSPHARLAFGVRMLQRAREQNTPIQWRNIQSIVRLAKSCRKVNVIIAVNRIMEQQYEQQQRSLLMQPDRTASLEAESTKRVVEHDASVDASVFYKQVGFFLRQQRLAAAVDLWKKFRSQALATCKSAALKASLLSRGAWICRISRDADEADWIGRAYNKHSIRPSARTLSLLTSTQIDAKNFPSARSCMCWINRLGYVLHETQLRAYLGASVQEKAEQLCGETLLALGGVLLDSPRLCSSTRERLRFLRAYSSALHDFVHSYVPPVHVNDAFRCIHRLFERWKVDDSILSGYVVYFASRAGHLEAALRVVQASHDQIQRPRNAADEKVHGLLHAFAYDALVERSVHEGKVHPVLDLLFEPKGNEELRAARAALIASNCIRTFGRLGRLDLCREVFDLFLKRYPAHASVSTAYMYELGKAKRSTEAVSLFRLMASPDGVAFSALGSVVLESVASNSESTESKLPAHVIAELLNDMAAYLQRLRESSAPDLTAASETSIPEGLTLEQDVDAGPKSNAEGFQRNVCGREEYERVKRVHHLSRVEHEIQEKLGRIREQLGLQEPH
ncbi:hypothetical protein FVE85_8197 [Porphyridium purpureum]|uniref:Uncharacterized protein n=1 Tax=Porphyridium purpureum TaxID=35688 RepID=A0A5J4YP13_PORPP|nr:hypothetical protein FVE85_8197 [Porphyridium purpureum]|eukprot:POR0974..scf295_9